MNSSKAECPGCGYEDVISWRHRSVCLTCNRRFRWDHTNPSTGLAQTAATVVVAGVVLKAIQKHREVHQ